MKILVLGATGQTGREIVTQGLERGYEVRALVRTPSKLAVIDPRLEIIEGSPLDATTLGRCVPGTNAVLSTLGHTDLKESSFVTDAAKALTAQMGRHGVKRLIIISSTLVAPGGSFLTRIPRLITRHAINDSARMEDAVRPTDLGWTIVRLVRLTSKAASPYRIFEDEPPSVSASISRKTVAGCMLDLLSGAAHEKKTLGICATRPHEVGKAGHARGPTGSA
jgi:putative NADH-flavin reductase